MQSFSYSGNAHTSNVKLLHKLSKDYISLFQMCATNLSFIKNPKYDEQNITVKEKHINDHLFSITIRQFNLWYELVQSLVRCEVYDKVGQGKKMHCRN